MAKRDDIVDAALDIVCEEGIRALTLPLLFKRAHTGAGTFYHYFEGREGLIDAVYDRCCHVVMVGLDGGDGISDPHDRFVRLFSDILDAYRDHPREMRFLYLYAYGYAEPDDRRSRVIPSILRLTKAISDAQAQGIVSRDVDAAASARIARGVAASVQWNFEHGICEIDESFTRELAERTWRAMVG